MKFTEVKLLTNDITEQHDFFADTLGLPIIKSWTEHVSTHGRVTDGFSVRVGESVLTFEREIKQAHYDHHDTHTDGDSTPDHHDLSDSQNSTTTTTPTTKTTKPTYGSYHYAFNIPHNQFPQAKKWLSQRTEVLGSANNPKQTQFHFDAWNADACYFRDKSGNIGELIARHTLPETASTSPFSSDSLLLMSEIGIPSNDVPRTVKQLSEKFGIKPYYGVGLRSWVGYMSSFVLNTQFQPVGSEEALFIVVNHGRLWIPTNVIPAVDVPHSIHVGNSTKSVAPLSDIPEMKLKR